MAEAPAAPPAAPPPLTLDLSRWSDAVSAAFHTTPMVIATSNAQGEPDVAFKGSFMVWDADHLAFWERALNETLAAVRANPNVCVLLRPAGSPPVRFYGQAELVEDPNLREAIWQKVIPDEQARDPDKKGYAVLIRVDRIRFGPQQVRR